MSSLQVLSTLKPAAPPGPLEIWEERFQRPSLRRNILAGSASSIGAAAIALVSYPIYLHYLGYESYGLWLAMSSVLTLSQLGCSGVTSAVAKLVAEEYNSARFGEMLTFLSTATLLVFGLSSLFALGVWLLEEPLLRLLRLDQGQAGLFRNLLPFMLALSAYSLVVEVFNAALLGMGAMERLGYSQMGTQLLTIVLSAVLLRRSFGVASLVIAGFASAICQHLVALGFISGSLPSGQAAGARRFDRKQLLRLSAFGGWMAAISLVNLLISPLNRFVLTRCCGAAAVPLYEIAFSGSMRLRGAMEAGMRALMPAVSGSAPGGLRRVRQLHSSAVKAILIGAMPVYALLWFSAPFWLNLWLGARFRAALVPATRIMLIGAFASLLCIPAYYLLLGLGKPRDCFLGQCLHGVVAFALIVALLLRGVPISVGTVCAAAACGMIATCAFLLTRFQGTHT